MTKEKAKALQTALWAGLVLVQMAVVGCLEVRAETIRREVIYEAVEGEAELPDEITVSVLAEDDEELVQCQAVKWEEMDSYWRDDFSFPVTFYEYGAGEYQLGEISVKKTNLENPAQLTELAQQHGTELLRSMGLSEEEYEVAEMIWTGSPYENEDGIVCRDAEAYGSRLLRDYRVVYEGDVEPERWQELKGGGMQEAEEEPLPEETGAEEAEQVVEWPETVVEPVPKPENEKQKKSKLQEFLEKITQIFLVIVGIGAIFFFGGLLVLALLWIYRKLRGWYDRRR